MKGTRPNPEAPEAPAAFRSGGKGVFVFLPPAIILGGGANAVSMARSLGRKGIKVYALNSPDSYVRFSRFSEWIPAADGESWRDLLLGPGAVRLRGGVLLAASDAAIEFIVKNRVELGRRFVLDISNPGAQLCMLNKLCTYERALEAGVPTPRFWKVREPGQVSAHEREYVYPMIVKPVYSHKFQEAFDCKFFPAQGFDELLDACKRAFEYGVEVMLVEKIPGPDSRLCSYYTYIDENGVALFDFTKRIIRRYPNNQGLACCHITDWNPEVRDLSLKYLAHVGLAGLANIEFKRDVRDGKLKLIECNARFTAANCLVSASGYDLALFVYNRLAGRTQPPLKGKKYRLGLRLWHPVEDFASFKELRRMGELGFIGWLGSVARPQVLPFFRFYDPLPTVIFESKRICGFIGRRAKRILNFQKSKDKSENKKPLEAR